jgi:hypothetical protein
MFLILKTWVMVIFFPFVSQEAELGVAMKSERVAYCGGSGNKLNLLL